MTWLYDLLGIKDIYVDSALVSPRRSAINLIPGANTQIVGVDDAGGGRTNVTITSTAGGAGGNTSDYKESVRVATTGALPAYTRTGDVITANANGALPTIDGVTLTAGTRRVFFWHGVSGTDNGTYDVTQLGSGGTPFILTRTVDADGTTETFTDGARVPIGEGTLYGGRTFKLTTNDPITLNVTSLVWALDTGLADGTANYQPLTWNGTTWVGAALNLAQAAAVTGILALANGGTGLGAPAGAPDADKVLRLNAGGTALEYAKLVSANLSASAAIAASQLAAGGAGNVLLGGTPNTWGQVTTSQISATAAIAASQLASGGANTVLWSNGSANSWTGSPTVTNLTVTALLTAGALAFGADPPETGTLRFSHLTNIVGEPSTPGADIPLLEWGNYVTDRLSLGHSSLGVLHLRAGNVSILDGSNTNVWSAGSSINVYVADTQWAVQVASPRLMQLTKTDDTAPQNFTITPQAPWASATVNTRGGDLVVALASPVGAGTAEAMLKVTRGGTFYAAIGKADAAAYSRVWLGPALTPSATNYALQSNGSSTFVNGISEINFAINGANNAIFTGALFEWTQGVAAPRIGHATKTGDSAPQDLNVAPQAPYASATGANRKPGSFVVVLAQPSAGGTETPLSRVTYAGSFTAGLGPRSSAHTASALWLGPALTPSSTNYALSSSASAATTSLNATTMVSLGISGNTYASLTTTLLTLDTATITWTEASTPQIAQIAWGSDNAPRNMTLAPQAPWASATGANRTPGSLIVALPAPVGGATTEARLRVTRGGSFNAAIGPYESAGGTYGAVYLGPGITPSSTNFALVSDGVGATYLNAPTGGTIYLSFNGSPSSGLLITASAATWGPTVSAPSLLQAPRSTDASVQNLTVRAQSAYASASTNIHGGHLLLQGGAEKGSAAGKKGGVRLQLNGTTETMLEATEVAIGQRVVVLCRGSDATTTQLPANTGDRVVYLADCATAPTGTPVGGGIISSQSGDIYWTDDAGVTSQLN